MGYQGHSLELLNGVKCVKCLFDDVHNFTLSCIYFKTENHHLDLKLRYSNQNVHLYVSVDQTFANFGGI